MNSYNKNFNNKLIVWYDKYYPPYVIYLNIKLVLKIITVNLEW